MITKEQIKIYNSYGGEIEGFDLIATSQEKEILSNQKWTVIDNLVYDLNLISKKLTSQSFNVRTHTFISENFHKDALDILNSLKW